MFALNVALHCFLLLKDFYYLLDLPTMVILFTCRSTGRSRFYRPACCLCSRCSNLNRLDLDLLVCALLYKSTQLLNGNIHVVLDSIWRKDADTRYVVFIGHQRHPIPAEKNSSRSLSSNALSPLAPLDFVSFASFPSSSLLPFLPSSSGPSFRDQSGTRGSEVFSYRANQGQTDSSSVERRKRTNRTKQIV